MQKKIAILEEEENSSGTPTINGRFVFKPDCNGGMPELWAYRSKDRLLMFDVRSCFLMHKQYNK